MPVRLGIARRRWRPAALGVVLLALAAGAALAQSPTGGGFNEREIRSQPTALDKGDVWALDFRFKDPRLIQVNVPGRGTRICWYLWYQVINRTAEPHTFIPDFELVTLDYPGVYYDEVLPSVQDAIKKIEDPTGYQDIKNSVTISARPIPPSRNEGERYPTAVTGVAIWDGTSGEPSGRDPGKKDLADSSRFSVFVSGLSNGWVLVDPVGEGPNAQPVVRRKTLQLNFKRLGDRFLMDAREISFVPPSEWVYRAARLRIPEAPAAMKEEPAKGAQLRPQLPNTIQIGFDTVR